MEMHWTQNGSFTQEIWGLKPENWGVAVLLERKMGMNMGMIWAGTEFGIVCCLSNLSILIFHASKCWVQQTPWWISL